jgi:hypothetical protein
MPFKYNNLTRHKIPKPKYQVNNTAEYNEALRKRENLTVWINDVNLLHFSGETICSIICTSIAMILQLSIFQAVSDYIETNSNYNSIARKLIITLNAICKSKQKWAVQ